MTPDRFSAARNDFVATLPESGEQRARAFLEPFGVDADRGGVFIDRSGHPLAVTPAWTEGLERYAADELRRAARAIADPGEIRIIWKTGADGRLLLTRRYIASIDGIDVAVEQSRAGWRFATSEDPGFSLDKLRAGELAWSAA
jgi:hypothetical protein